MSTDGYCYTLSKRNKLYQIVKRHTYGDDGRLVLFFNKLMSKCNEMVRITRLDAMTASLMGPYL